MTPPLTLDEFTAALCGAFPDAEVTNIRTSNQRWLQHHAATVTLHGFYVTVTYNLNPLDANMRWDVVWSDGPVATASQLRGLMRDMALKSAKTLRKDAAALVARSKEVAAAAARIEAEMPVQQPPTAQGD